MSCCSRLGGWRKVSFRGMVSLAASARGMVNASDGAAPGKVLIMWAELIEGYLRYSCLCKASIVLDLVDSVTVAGSWAGAGAGTGAAFVLVSSTTVVDFELEQPMLGSSSGARHYAKTSVLG